MYQQTTTARKASRTSAKTTSKLTKNSFDYSDILPRKHVMVTLDDRTNTYTHLSEDMLNYGRKYGFQFRSSQFIEPLTQDLRLSHLILITDIVKTPYFWDDLKDDIHRATETYSSATICISYKSKTEFLEASNIIDAWKSEFGPSINFLRPDDRFEPVLPNYNKILDNSVCDTVRVKYKPIRKYYDYTYPDPVINYFKSCSTLYREKELHHRAPTDGFFCCRYLDHIFITSTRTDKIQMDNSRISVIHEYNEEKNEIIFSGKYIPSSDSVEACVLLSRLPGITALMHTHASEKITRNPKMKKYILVPPLPYGESDLGHSIADALIKSERSWGIMEDHGEIFVADAHDLTEAYFTIENTVTEAANEGR